MVSPRLNKVIMEKNTENNSKGEENDDFDLENYPEKKNDIRANSGLASLPKAKESENSAKEDMFKSSIFVFEEEPKSNRNGNSNLSPSSNINFGFVKEMQPAQKVNKTSRFSVHLSQAPLDQEKQGDEVHPELEIISLNLDHSMLSDEYERREDKLEEMIDKDKTLNHVKPCIICDSKLPDSILEPCNHGGMCYNCCEALLSRHNAQCPFCRQVNSISFFDSNFFRFFQILKLVD
jgi:hypothetical protein